jgi:hypothetical protein
MPWCAPKDVFRVERLGGSVGAAAGESRLLPN